MKPSEIEIGKTYRNRGAGRTKRKVMDIGEHVAFDWLGYEEKDPPSNVGVRFAEGNGSEKSLCLSSFAAWAGSVVEEK